MIKVKITMGENGFPAQSQLPEMKPVWKDCLFFVNDDTQDCDFWFVWGNLHKKQKAFCAPENTFFISSEPPTIYKYQNKFLKQFKTIITCDKNTKHKNPIYQQQSLPWWLGHDLNNSGSILKDATYDELIKNNRIHKDKKISIIVSNKQSTEGHRKRLEFAKKIKERFGDQIDMFGVGLNECRYKWDAISPYKYHIVIENSSLDDYWTEKLSDSILAESYTFYYGCKNIDKYFDKDIYTGIDIDDVTSSIKTIEEKMDQNFYEKNIDKIIQAKHLILDEYQLFPNIHKICSALSVGKKKEIILKPEGRIYQLIQKIKNYGFK